MICSSCVTRTQPRWGIPIWKPPEANRHSPTPASQPQGGEDVGLQAQIPGTLRLGDGRRPGCSFWVSFWSGGGKAWTPARGALAAAACAVALIGLWRPRFTCAGDSAKKGNGALDGRARLDWTGQRRNPPHCTSLALFLLTLARSSFDLGLRPLFFPLCIDRLLLLLPSCVLLGCVDACMGIGDRRQL